MEIMKKIKDNLAFYVLVLILFFVFYYFVNIFAYFDLPNLCYISLEKDALNGNKITLHQAIGLLKKNDRADYKNLCRFVKTVSEKYCFAFDPRVENNSQNPYQPGCFVKGSKTIYLKPEKEQSAFVIQKRAEELKKFMLMSKSFWETQK